MLLYIQLIFFSLNLFFIKCYYVLIKCVFQYDEATDTYPDLVEQFKKKHTKGGKWNSPVAEEQYVSNSF